MMRELSILLEYEIVKFWTSVGAARGEEERERKMGGNGGERKKERGERERERERECYMNNNC